MEVVFLRLLWFQPTPSLGGSATVIVSHDVRIILLGVKLKLLITYFILKTRVDQLVKM